MAGDTFRRVSHSHYLKRATRFQNMNIFERSAQCFARRVRNAVAAMPQALALMATCEPWLLRISLQQLKVGLPPTFRVPRASEPGEHLRRRRRAGPGARDQAPARP